MSVFDWMTQAKLNINPIKTEFLLIGCEFQRQSLSIFPLPNIPSRFAKRLGVLFEKIFFFAKIYLKRV